MTKSFFAAEMLLLIGGSQIWAQDRAVSGATDQPEMGTSRETWQPADPSLMTRWAKDVSPSNTLPEYPRPQMVRKHWQSLNGLWQFAGGDKGEAVPVGKNLARKILVPFPMESALSGIRETADFCWYRRSFTLPADWNGQRILLHFGAVDWETTVYVNGRRIGSHRGGYDPFYFDITDALTSTGPQELIVGVYDPMKSQLSGKQSKSIFLNPRRSIFYSCVTGIWQTVWLEPVPAVSIAKLRLTPDVDAGLLRVNVEGRNAGSATGVSVVASAGGQKIGSAEGKPGEMIGLPIADAHLWTPEDPFLYDLEVSLKQDGRAVDSVQSYFAMRKVSIGKDKSGITRLLLNNRFTFQMGSLDQGFWPGGIYTAPTDEALRFDIEFAKRIGLNLARKHVKIEPARWYHWCDKLGLLVWQDMPTFSLCRGYKEEAARIIDSLRNHPSIVVWVMLNEGRSGGEDQQMVETVARRSDPTRPIVAISGWRDKGFGDLIDRHDYPGPSSPMPEGDRAAILGEWGRTGGHVPGHDWMEVVAEAQYPAWSSPNESLDRRHEAMVHRMWRLAHTPGLSGAAWTQLTDIEGETNGLITYDRAVIKNDVARIAAANRGFVPPIALPDASWSRKSKDALYGLFDDSVRVQLIAPRPETVIRYTLDGSEPTAQSPRYTEPIQLKETTTVKAVSFWPDHPPSAPAAFVYRKVAKYQPAAEVAADGLRPGLAWQYLEDDKVLESGTIPRFTFRPDDPYVPRPGANGRFVWSGCLKVPRDGVYTFQRPAENMGLRIGPTTLFSGSGGLGNREATAQRPLKAGYHRIEAHWIQKRRGYYSLDCPMHVEGPGLEKQPIPASLLYH